MLSIDEKDSFPDHPCRLEKVAWRRGGAAASAYCIAAAAVACVCLQGEDRGVEKVSEALSLGVVWAES